jgi:hypothetical protein
MEPIPASGERDGKVYMTDIFPKKEKSEEVRKNGLLPRIKRLSVKRSLKDKSKKYKYNLPITPAEQLFGSTPQSSESSGNKQGIKGNGSDERIYKDDIGHSFRPTSRLSHYKDINPISVAVGHDINPHSSGVNYSNAKADANFTLPHTVTVPSPPSSLLLQIAPEENRISSTTGISSKSDKIFEHERAKSGLQKPDRIIYADIDHRHIKGNFLLIQISLVVILPLSLLV